MTYTLAAWAELCTVSKPAVTQGVRRGLLVKSDDGKIDDTNPVNALYRAQHPGGSKPVKAETPKTTAKAKPIDPEQVEFNRATAKRQAKKLTAETGINLADLSPAERRKLNAMAEATKSDLGEAATLPIEKFKADIALKKSQTKNHEFTFSKRKAEVITKEEFRRVAELWNTNLSQSVMRVPRRVIARLWSMARSGADKMDGELELEKALSAAVTRALEGVVGGK